MEKNNGRVVWELEEMAKIAESVQSLYKGKAMIIFELESDEYKKTISYFREIDRHHKQFSIDISGTEFLFILKEDKS